MIFSHADGCFLPVYNHKSKIFSIEMRRMINFYLFGIWINKNVIINLNLLISQTSLFHVVIMNTERIIYFFQ